MCYVTMSGNTNVDVYLYKFDKFDEAKDFLQWLWEDKLNDAIANDEDIDQDFTYHEDIYAQLHLKNGDNLSFSLYRETDTIPEEFYKRGK